ncbi:hypothetical protein PG994_002783 [Apiospora phragmitis]|uniref:Gamma-glutamyltransferase n=1 Tax=Apiospora phragmitis TaxID=2905665 RepID=A0ABR1W641_9PEZI
MGYATAHRDDPAYLLPAPRGQDRAAIHNRAALAQCLLGSGARLGAEGVLSQDALVIAYQVGSLGGGGFLLG